MKHSFFRGILRFQSQKTTTKKKHKKNKKKTHKKKKPKKKKKKKKKKHATNYMLCWTEAFPLNCVYTYWDWLC